MDGESEEMKIARRMSGGREKKGICPVLRTEPRK